LSGEGESRGTRRVVSQKGRSASKPILYRPSPAVKGGGQSGEIGGTGSWKMDEGAVNEKVTRRGNEGGDVDRGNLGTVGWDQSK